MSTEVQTEVSRIEQNVANTYAVLAGLGADMPADQNSDNLARTAGAVKAVLYSAQTLTEAQKTKARQNIGAVSKDGLLLGIHTDGLVYLFVDGVPVGNGIEMGVSGDVFGYVDENNNIVVQGSLPDGTYTVKYEMEDGSTVEIGNLVLDSNVYYSVTNNLTNCTNSNGASEVIGGQSYSAVISANDGYELSSVTVTNGGESVPVTDGVIEIAEVKGNIVITAVAEEATVEIINWVPRSTDSSGAVYNGTGYKSGVRLKSDGVTESTQIGYGKTCVLTGFIPVASGDVIRAKNVTFADTSSTTGYVSQLWLYGSAYGKLKNYQYGTEFTPTEVDGIYTFTVPGDVSGVAHMRLQAEVLDGNSIITRNQEIV